MADIVVIIPTRNRVKGLSVILASLQMLESGKNRVRYAIGCDEDDTATLEYASVLHLQAPDRIACRIGPRPVTLGGLVNEMADHMRADIYTSLCDDTLCVTPFWDDVLAQAAEKTPHGVFFWQNAFPARCHWAAVTEKWRAAAGGIFTSHYPYWFDDLCLEEQWIMATDADPIYLECRLADRPVNTMRMRELKFWRDFFTKTRALRVKQGAMIAQRLGLPKPRLAEAFAREWTRMLGECSDEYLEKIEKGQGDLGAPDASYQIAKRNAEVILGALQ